MKNLTQLKRNLKTLEKIEGKRIETLRVSIQIIFELVEDEIINTKKEVINYIESLNLSNSYKVELRGLYNSFFSLSLNKEREEKIKIIEVIEKINNYKKLRDFIRSLKKLPVQEALEKINEVKGAGKKPAPKSKETKIEINKFDGIEVPSNDAIIIDSIKSKISTLLNEGNVEKLMKLYQFLQEL